jgi:hypothetical protein
MQEAFVKAICLDDMSASGGAVVSALVAAGATRDPKESAPLTVGQALESSTVSKGMAGIAQAAVERHISGDGVMWKFGRKRSAAECVYIGKGKMSGAMDALQMSLLVTESSVVPKKRRFYLCSTPAKVARVGDDDSTADELAAKIIDCIWPEPKAL